MAPDQRSTVMMMGSSGLMMRIKNVDFSEFLLRFGNRVDEAHSEFLRLGELHLDPACVVADALFELGKYRKNSEAFP